MNTKVSLSFSNGTDVLKQAQKNWRTLRINGFELLIGDRRARARVLMN